MSIETLKSRLPDYAKDLRLNLSSLGTEAALTEQQRAGSFVASALASRSPAVSASSTGQPSNATAVVTTSRVVPATGDTTAR